MKTFSVSFAAHRPPQPPMWDHWPPLAYTDLQTAYQHVQRRLGLEDRVEFTLVQETPHRIIVEIDGMLILIQELVGFRTMILN